MVTRWIVSLLCLFAVATGSMGCLAVTVGAGAGRTVGYLSDDREAPVSHDIDTVFAASMKALAEFDLRVVEDRTRKDASSATIVARDAAGEQVIVKLESSPTATTGISVRAETSDSDAKCQRIHDQIRKHLTIE